MAARPLNERIAAALKSDARLADVEATLAEALAEHARTIEAKADAEARRVDPALSDEAAAEAQLDAEEMALRLIRLDRAAEKLRETIAAKKAAASDDERKRRYGKVAARRRALVAGLREDVAPALALIADYCARIVESDAEVDDVNQALPPGCKRLAYAEAEARGFAGHIWGDFGSAVVMRLPEMRIPHFDRSSTAWPDVEGREQRNAAAGAKAAEAAEDALRRREGTKARFIVSRPVGTGEATLHHADGAERAGAPRIERELYPDQVKLARKHGFTVEPWTPETAVWREYRIEPAVERGEVRPELISTRDGTRTVAEPCTAWLNAALVTAAREAGLKVAPIAAAARTVEPAQAAA